MRKKTLVIGASLNQNRYSNRAIQKLKNHNHEVVALGLRTGEVVGVKIVMDAIDFQHIDTVTLYLNPSRQEQYYQYIIGLQPKRVIFNPGTENPEFYSILKEAGIAIEVACTLVLLATDQY